MTLSLSTLKMWHALHAIVCARYAVMVQTSKKKKKKKNVGRRLRVVYFRSEQMKGGVRGFRAVVGRRVWPTLALGACTSGLGSL